MVCTTKWTLGVPEDDALPGCLLAAIGMPTQLQELALLCGWRKAKTRPIDRALPLHALPAKDKP